MGSGKGGDGGGGDTDSNAGSTDCSPDTRGGVIDTQRYTARGEASTSPPAA